MHEQPPAMHDPRTLGERLADRIAAFGGSWTFIIIFLLFLVAWAMVNTEILGPRQEAFDPYPYVFLNLVLSMLAAIQAPVILMAQNRSSTRDRLRAVRDYHVNRQAEREIRHLHRKVDELRAAQWEELLRLQHAQLEQLAAVVQALAAAHGGTAVIREAPHATESANLDA